MAKSKITPKDPLIGKTVSPKLVPEMVGTVTSKDKEGYFVKFNDGSDSYFEKAEMLTVVSKSKLKIKPKNVAQDNLNFRVKEMLNNSLALYKMADKEKQAEYIADVKSKLALDKKGESIGFPLDKASVLAGKQFLKQVASLKNTPEVDWKNGSRGHKYIDYKLGTILWDGDKGYKVKFGPNETSQNATSLDDAKSKLDIYTKNKETTPIAGKKIPLKEIVIHWAEGDNSRYDKFPKTYQSWAAADKAILPIYRDYAKDGGGGYNKTKFTIFFEDGEDYGGRLDVSETEDNPTQTKNVIGQHIYDWFQYQLSDRATTSEKAKEEIREWLAKYDLGLEDDNSNSSNKPAPKRVKKSVEDVKPNKVKTKPAKAKFRMNAKVLASDYNTIGTVLNKKWNSEIFKYEYEILFPDKTKEWIFEPSLKKAPAAQPYMYNNKKMKDLSTDECEQLRKEIRERRKKSATAEKKSKSKPIIEKVAANVAMAVKQTIKNVPVIDIKHNPIKEIAKFELIEKEAKIFLSKMKSILGEDYDKESINDEFADIHNIIKELKKKYS